MAETFVTSLYSDEQWGNIARENLLTYQNRYSLTHGPRLRELLSLSDRELGLFCRRNPILSKVTLSRNSFLETSKKEGSREGLAKWIQRNNIPLLSQMQRFELSLFTDGRELVCGITEDQGEKGKKVIRVLRNPKITSQEEIEARIRALADLIPPTEFYFDPADREILIISDFVEGREPTAAEVAAFKDRLKEKGFNPETFDLNEGNLTVVDGRVFFVDMEDLVLE